MTKILFLPLSCTLVLGACAPKVQPICPDAVYNKYGYTQDCRDTHRGSIFFFNTPNLINNPESLSERRGEPEGGSRVPTPQPPPQTSSTPPVSAPEGTPKETPEDTPKEDVQDEPQKDPPESKPKEEPEADRPEPDHTSPSDGGDKSPHEDKTRPDKDHPKKAKAKGC